MASVSDPVLVSIIGMIGGIVISYITNVVAKRIEANRTANAPKDRVELVFEWYDKALKQSSDDNAALREDLREALDKLEKSDDENIHLKKELRRIRDEYRKHKYEPQP